MKSDAAAENIAVNKLSVRGGRTISKKVVGTLATCRQFASFVANFHAGRAMQRRLHPFWWFTLEMLAQVTLGIGRDAEWRFHEERPSEKEIGHGRVLWQTH